MHPPPNPPAPRRSLDEDGEDFPAQGGNDLVQHLQMRKIIYLLFAVVGLTLLVGMGYWAYRSGTHRSSKTRRKSPKKTSTLHGDAHTRRNSRERLHKPNSRRNRAIDDSKSKVSKASRKSDLGKVGAAAAAGAVVTGAAFGLYNLLTNNANVEKSQAHEAAQSSGCPGWALPGLTIGGVGLVAGGLYFQDKIKNIWNKMIGKKQSVEDTQNISENTKIQEIKDLRSRLQRAENQLSQAEALASANESPQCAERMRDELSKAQDRVREIQEELESQTTISADLKRKLSHAEDSNRTIAAQLEKERERTQVEDNTREGLNEHQKKISQKLKALGRRNDSIAAAESRLRRGNHELAQKRHALEQQMHNTEQNRLQTDAEFKEREEALARDKEEHESVKSEVLKRLRKEIAAARLASIITRRFRDNSSRKKSCWNLRELNFAKPKLGWKMKLGNELKLLVNSRTKWTKKFLKSKKRTSKSRSFRMNYVD